jgi:hypothetical protein
MAEFDMALFWKNENTEISGSPAAPQTIPGKSPVNSSFYLNFGQNFKVNG